LREGANFMFQSGKSSVIPTLRSGVQFITFSRWRPID